MKFGEQPKSVVIPENESDLSFNKPKKKPGEQKVDEYVGRIMAGESKEAIFRGLPESFRRGIEDRIAQITEGNDVDIPPQYKGLDSETLDLVWVIPEYIDPKKTKELREKKASAIAALRAQEADKKEADKLRKELGAEKSEKTARGSKNKEAKIPLLEVEERKKLSGWSASYELAKVAKNQGVDLSAFSREEYVDFAIQNSLAIDDSQLRMPPWQRMCTSAPEIVSLNKANKAKISDKSDKEFQKFYFDIMKKAEEDDRSLDKNISVRQGTKNSNSWLFFKVNGGALHGSKEMFKAYISMKDLNTLTPQRFTQFMAALRDAGYNGDTKIFQDLKGQGINLNDQIVMHGASEADAQLALKTAESFFGNDLDQKSVGKDEIIDGKNLSYSQILAKKIKDTINNVKK